MRSKGCWNCVRKGHTASQCARIPKNMGRMSTTYAIFHRCQRDGTRFEDKAIIPKVGEYDNDDSSSNTEHGVNPMKVNGIFSICITGPKNYTWADPNVAYVIDQLATNEEPNAEISAK